MSDSSNITLLGGTGRCGTTIVSRVLGRHPRIAVTPEWRFMIDPDGVLEFCASAGLPWTPYHYDLRLKRLAATLAAATRSGRLEWLVSRFRPRWAERLIGRRLRRRYGGIDAEQSCPGFSELVSSLIDRLSDFRFPGTWIGAEALSRTTMVYGAPPVEARLTTICAEFYRGVMSSLAARAGGTHCIDKNTWNILWFDGFRQLVPEIKLIHVYRDPLDVVASFLTQEWMPDDPGQAATIYRDLMEQWWRLREGVPENACLELRFEDLTRDARGETRRMCDFVGVDFDETMLDIDLSQGNIGGWRSRIPERHHERVIGILTPVRATLGYGE